MASKLVTDRQKGADAVLAISDAQGDMLAGAAGEAIGSEATAVQSTLTLLRGALQMRRDQMLEADTQHESELADDSSVRDERDQAAAALTEKVVELREPLTSLYGAKAARAAIVGKTPQDPVALERFAGEVIQNLGTATWPEPRFAGASLDFAAVAADLSAAREALQSALGQVATGAREAQSTLAQKNQAIEEFDQAFTGVATSLSELFTLVGERELADKVRPSVRRPGQTVEQARSRELNNQR